jgi:hypothetical protein
MSKENVRKPRDGCAWTDARCEQFKNLESLLNAVSMLNHSTNFIGNVQRCIELADHLRKWDMDLPSPSFIDFLRGQIIEDRFPKETP